MNAGYFGSMKRTVFAVVVAVSVLAVGPSVSAASKKYKNCTLLRVVYPNGVAKTKAAAKMTGAKYAPSVYAANKKMDRDNDGVACEI